VTLSEGAWIFLSHSHRDFDKVASVRNHLEQMGHHPLMFFLKCLDDSDEIDGLIRREIEARSWFILCNTSNSRKSRWVKAELQIIGGLPEKTYEEIDLDDPDLDLDAGLYTITHRASVFLSYHRSDAARAHRIRQALLAKDFGVFSDLELAAGENWRERVESELENAARRGAVLVLLSVESVRSRWQQSEMLEARRIAERYGRSANLIPVFLDNPEEVLVGAPSETRYALQRIQAIDFSRGEFEQNMSRLMGALREFPWQRG
jgi:hypothetical protein